MIHDVVILGGGPAGSAAGRLLASWGRSVLILARGGARDAMAESLPPSAAKLLDRVGMLGAVEQGGFVRSSGNSVRWESGDTRPEYFGEGALGWQVRRDSFDAVLLASAASVGAKVIPDASAREVSDPDADGVRDVLFEGVGRQTVQARWVLDCTGRSGLVARRGWRSSESAARTLAIVGVWSCEAGWELRDASHTIVESYDAGWAWSIPVSAGQRYVTVMVDPAHTSIGSGPALTVTYLAALGRTVAMRELVATATLTGMPWARESSPYGFTRAGEQGVLLVGDAASFVDPLSSYGMKKAFASAWLAAVVTHAALGDSAIVPHALELYQSREREMHDELQRQAASLARDAAARHGSDFWSDRGRGAAGGGLQPGAWVHATRAAFEDIRSRPRIALRCADSLAYIPRAMVTGNLLAVAPHLVTPAAPHPIRFVRNVDVVGLCEIADCFDQVPDLFHAYNRHAGTSCELPDFLAALATLVAIGALELLDSPPPGS